MSLIGNDFAINMDNLKEWYKEVYINNLSKERFDSLMADIYGREEIVELNNKVMNQIINDPVKPVYKIKGKKATKLDVSKELYEKAVETNRRRRVFENVFNEKIAKDFYRITTDLKSSFLSQYANETKEETNKRLMEKGVITPSIIKNSEEAATIAVSPFKAAEEEASARGIGIASSAENNDSYLYRYGLLKDTVKENFETWDINPAVVRDNLVSWNDDTSKWESAFVDDKFIEELQSHSFLDDEYIYDQAKKRHADYKESSSKFKHSKNLLDNLDKFEIDYAPGNPVFKLKEEFKNDSKALQVEKELTDRFKKYHDDKLTGLSKLRDGDENGTIKSLDKEIADNRIGKKRLNSEIQQLRAMSEVQIAAIENTKIYTSMVDGKTEMDKIREIKKTINNRITIKQNELTKLKDKGDELRKQRINADIQVKKSFGILYDGDEKTYFNEFKNIITNEVNENASDFYKKDSLHSNIKSVINTDKSDEIVSFNKPDVDALEGFYNEKSIVEKRISNINSVWINKEKIPFKQFNSKEEFDEAISTIKDPEMKNVVENFYEHNPQEGTFTKKNFMVYSTIDKELFRNGKSETISLDGITDIPNFDSRPSNINKFFKLTDDGNQEVYDSNKLVITSNNDKRHIVEIKNTLEKYKEAQRSLSVEEKKMSLLRLREINDNSKEAQQEMHEQVQSNLDVTEEVKNKAKKDKTPVEVETNWLGFKERKLLGKDSSRKLSKFRQANTEQTSDNIKPKADVDLNKEYVSIVDNIEAIFNDKNKNSILDEEGKKKLFEIKDTYETHLSALKSLDYKLSKLRSGNVKEANNARLGYVKEGSKNNYLISNKYMKSAKNELGFYGEFSELNNEQFASVVDKAMDKISIAIDKNDNNLLSLIKSTTEYTPDSDAAVLLKEQRNNNIEEVRYGDDLLDRGVTQLEKNGGDIFENASDENKRVMEELASNDDIYQSQVSAIMDAEGRPISVIQQKDLSFVATAMKKNSDVIKVTNLKRPLTLKELETGRVMFPETSYPVEHFSEFYELMSMKDLQREGNLPFTNDEWINRKVTFKESGIEVPLDRFYEYYNENIRKAQNQSVIDSITPSHTSEIKKHKSQDVNKAIHDYINSENGSVQYYSRAKKEFVDVPAPMFRVEQMPTAKTKMLKKKALELGMETNRVNPNEMLLPDGTIGKVTVDNFDEVRKFYGVDNVPLPEALSNKIQSFKNLSKKIDEQGLSYNEKVTLGGKVKNKKVIGGSDIEIYNRKEVEDVVSKLVPNEITADDAIAFETYHNNKILSRKSKKDGGQTRLLIKPKEIDKKVKSKLRIAKESGTDGIRLKGDTLLYDVIKMDDKTVTLQAPHILAKDIKLKLNIDEDKDVFGVLKEANAKNIRREIGHEDKFKSILKNLDTPIIVSEADALGNVSPAAINRRKLYEMLSTTYTDKVKTTDAVGNNVKVYMHDISAKAMLIDFPWIKLKKEELPAMSALSEFAVAESIAELKPAQLQASLKKYGVTLKDFENVGDDRAVLAIEDAISESVKGKLIRGYMDGSSGGGKSSSSGLVRVAKKYLEAEDRKVDVDSIQQVLREMSPVVKKDNELNKFFGDIDKLINDSDEIKVALKSESTNVSFEQQMESYIKNMERMDSESLQGSVYQRNMFATTDERLFKDLIHHDVNENIKADVESDIVRNADHKYLSKQELNNKLRDAKKKVAEVDATKVLGFSPEAYSNLRKEVKEMLIEDGGGYFKKEDLDEELEYILKEKFNNNKRMLAVVERSNKDDDFLKSFKYNLREEFTIEANKALSKENNTLRALKVLHDNEGFNVVQQYVDMKGGKKGFAGGLKEILPTGESMQRLLSSLTVSNTEDYEQLVMLENLVPGVSIEARAKDSNGNMVTYNVSDSKRNFNGDIGNVVQANNGEWYSVVDSAEQAKKVLFLGTVSNSDIDIETKNQTLKQDNIPLLIKPTKDLASADKYNVFTNTNFDYDTISKRRDGKFGKVSMVQSLKNFSDLVENGGRAVTMDYETTGLQGNLPEDLFQATQVAIQEVFVKKDKNGNTVFKRAPVESKYLAPSLEVFSKMAELSDTSSTDALVNSLGDKNNSDIWLMKNYGKYDDRAIKTGDFDSTYGDLFMRDIRVADKPLEDGSMQKIIQFKDDVDGKQVWKNTELSPAQYVSELQERSFDVAKHLKNKHSSRSKFGIDRSDVFETEQDMLKYISQKTEGKYVIGHNISSADLPWTETFANRAYDADIQRIKKMGKTAVPKVYSNMAPRIIDTMEIARVAMPGRSNTTLDNLGKDLNINVDGMAHLADVDTNKTTLLAEKMANMDSLKPTLLDMQNPLTAGDYIVKIGTDEKGITGLDKGVYRFNGVDGKKLLLEQFADADTESEMIEFTIPNTASLQREASNNWIRFSDKESALKFNANTQMTDSLRTFDNAINKGDTLDLYRVRGKYGNNQPIIEQLTALRGAYKTAQQKLGNTGGSRKWNNVNLTDAERLAVANASKLSDDNFDAEIKRLSEPIDPRRKAEFKAVSDYLDTDEGKMVDSYLKKGRDRLQAGIFDREDFKEYSRSVHDTIANVKSKAIENNLLKPEDFKVKIENNFVGGIITPESLVEANGGAYKLQNTNPFNINLDFSNRHSLEQSMWNAVDKIAPTIYKTSASVDSMKAAKAIALNQFVMPEIGKLIDDENIVKAIAGHKSNLISSPLSPKVEIDPMYKNTLTASADFLFRNKDTITSKLKPVEVINTLKATSPIENKEVFEKLDSTLQKNLQMFDDLAATVDLFNEEGQLEPTVVPEIANIHKELVKIQEADREQSVQIMSDLTGKPVDSVTPFVNTAYRGSKARAIESNLPNMSGINLINPTDKELGLKTAQELKHMADSKYTERNIPYPSSFESIIKDPNKRQAAYNLVPEYEEIIKRDLRLSDVSHISKLNDHILKNMKDEVYEPMRKIVNNNLSDRANIYKELYARTKQGGMGRFAFNKVDPNELSITNPTKFEAMKELGLIQNYVDNSGKTQFYTGKIGLPETFKVGQELDPGKVLLTTGASVTRQGKNSTYDTPRGYYSGKPLTAVPLNELRQLAESEYTPRGEKQVINNYLSNPDVAKVHTREFANSNFEIVRDQIKKTQVNDKPIVPNNTSSTLGTTPSYISNLNDNVINSAEDAVDNSILNPLKASANVADDIEDIIESPLTRMTNKVSMAANDIGSNARSILREAGNSNLLKYGLAGIAFAGALALTQHRTSDGGDPDARPQGNQAPTVDGKFKSEYNGNEHDRIKTPPKTVRVEENGRGLNISVRAKNRGLANDKQIESALSDTMNNTIKTQINIRQTDDRQSIDVKYVQDLFSQALEQ